MPQFREQRNFKIPRKDRNEILHEVDDENRFHEKPRPEKFTRKYLKTAY